MYSFFVVAETLEIEKIYEEKILNLEEMPQFSDEEFNFYEGGERQLKNRETIYWIVLSGLILFFLVLLSYTLYRIFKKD